jgi:hypothetical protein
MWGYLFLLRLRSISEYRFIITRHLETHFKQFTLFHSSCFDIIVCFYFFMSFISVLML